MVEQVDDGVVPLCVRVLVECCRDDSLHHVRHRLFGEVVADDLDLSRQPCVGDGPSGPGSGHRDVYAGEPGVFLEHRGSRGPHFVRVIRALDRLDDLDPGIPLVQDPLEALASKLQARMFEVGGHDQNLALADGDRDGLARRCQFAEGDGD